MRTKENFRNGKINLKSKKTDFIISNPLINYYLKSNGIKSHYIDIENFNIELFKENFISKKTAKVIGNYSELFENNYEILIDSIYYSWCFLRFA